MKTKPILSLFIIGLLAASSALQAQTSAVPDRISYQGYVTDLGGTPIGNTTPENRIVIFRIWDVVSGGNNINTLWYSEQQTVTISKGEFSVLVGGGANVTTQPLGFLETSKGPTSVNLGGVFTGAARYLGVTVYEAGGVVTSEISPRHQIVSTAYTLRAKLAEGVTPGAINNSEMIGAGVITGSNIGSATITNANLVDTTITDAKLGVISAANKVANSATTAATTNTFNAIVLRDGSGNFSAGTITANLVGNISGTAGNVTGTVALANGGTGSTTKNFVDLSTDQTNIGGEKSFTSAVSLLRGTSAAPANGVSGSTGSRLILWQGSATDTPYGLGIGPFALWYGTHSTGNHRWYTGTTEQMSLSNAGVLTLPGTASIGTTTAPTGSTKLIIQGDDASGGQVVIQGNTSTDKKLTLGMNTTNNYGVLKATGASTTTYPLVINPTGGNVAIGSTNATELSQCRLFVAGSTGLSVGSSHAYFVSGQSDWTGANAFTSPAAIVSIRATDEIVARAYRSLSDERIKLIEGVSNSATDLQTLLQIPITNYRHKDALAHGSAKKKKVIAQQVEKVFPQAVSQQTDIVPDIFKKAPYADGWVLLTTDLKKGDRVRLMDDANQVAIEEVLETAEGKFRTAFKPAKDQVFVYGREVKDCRIVDYEAISMLNVSATQEIARRLEAKTAEVEALEERVKALEARDKARDAKLAAFERLLDAMEKPAARTVSLKTGAE